MHLESRVAKLEKKIFPKDESIILINPSENINITHNKLENKSQSAVSTELNKLKHGCPTTTSKNVEPKVAPPNDTPVYSSDHLGPLNNTKKVRTSNFKKNKATVPCPFLKRQGYCLKGSRCDFSHMNVLPTAYESEFQQHPTKRPPSSKIPHLHGNQFPSPPIRTIFPRSIIRCFISPSRFSSSSTHHSSITIF